MSQNVPATPDAPVTIAIAADIGLVFLRFNPKKAMGLDRDPSQELCSWADQLAEVFIDIFNLSVLLKDHHHCTEAISLALLLSLEHLDNKDTYIRLLLINYSSAFNTIIPSRLISKTLTLCTLQLRKLGISTKSLTDFTVESILSGCTMAWNGDCSTQDRKKLQKVVYTAWTITEANLPSTDAIYMVHCCKKAANIKDPSHPDNALLQSH
eukprot:g34179.t1